MANFRAERVFIRIDSPIDGFDPNMGVDPEEFSNLLVDDQSAYGRDSIADFAFAPFDKKRWFPAAKGLETIRKVIAEHQIKVDATDDDRKSSLLAKIQSLRAVEDRLDKIDTHDRHFYFLVKDLE